MSTKIVGGQSCVFAAHLLHTLEIESTVFAIYLLLSRNSSRQNSVFLSTSFICCFLILIHIRLTRIRHPSAERARLVAEHRAADELEEATETSSDMRVLEEATRQIWNRISYAVALTGAQDFAHSVVR